MNGDIFNLFVFLNVEFNCLSMSYCIVMLTIVIHQVKPSSDFSMDVGLNFGERFRDEDNKVHFHRSLTFLHTEESTIINSTFALSVSTFLHTEEITPLL